MSNTKQESGRNITSLQNTANETRGTRKPRGTFHGRDHTEAQRLLRRYGIDYGDLSAACFIPPTTCHAALSKDKYQSTGYGRVLRVRWAVEQLLRDRMVANGDTNIITLADIWDEYDRPVIDELTRTVPDPLPPAA